MSPEGVMGAGPCLGRRSTAGQMDALGRGWKWGACERAVLVKQRVNESGPSGHCRDGGVGDRGRRFEVPAREKTGGIGRRGGAALAPGLGDTIRDRWRAGQSLGD